jgi:hypothetical protein
MNDSLHHQLTKHVQLMNVSGLSRDNVASHLQKYRMGFKRSRPRKRSAPEPGEFVAAGASATARRKHRKRSFTALTEPELNRSPGELACGSDVEADQAREQAEARAKEREGSNPNANEGSCGVGGAAGFNASGSDDGAGAGSDNRNSEFLETAAQSPGHGHVRKLSAAALPVLPLAAVDSRARDMICTHENVPNELGSGPNWSREGSNTDGKCTGNDLRASTGGTSNQGSGGAGSGTGAGARVAGNAPVSASPPKPTVQHSPTGGAEAPCADAKLS